MSTGTYASSARVDADQRVVLRLPTFNGIIPVGAALAAASIVAGASNPTFASSVNPELLGSGASRVVLLARKEDVGVSITDALAEIKRRAGLTWQNLADIFGVSRKSVHNWVNGEPVKVVHAGLVEGLLERVRAATGLRPFQLRRLLLTEFQVIEELKTATTEPAILVSDPTPFKHQIAVRKGGTTKVVRSRSEREG